MTPKDTSGNAGRPLAAEVAIIGAGPVGLMTANLLGLAGIRVLVLERNAGLLGLPRAIAYDAETLRLFSQVGLFDEIAPGLIQDPARAPSERAQRHPDGGRLPARALRPFFARHLLPARLREGPAQGPRAIPVGPGRLRPRGDRSHSEREGRDARGRDAIGRDHGRSELCRRLRRRREPHAGAPRRQARRLDLFGALAGGRRDRQESQASSRSLSPAIRAGPGSSCPRSASGCGGSSCNCPGKAKRR